jgi:hypothetical protein
VQNASLTVEERSVGEATVQAAGQFFAVTSRDPSSVSFRNVFLGKRPKPTSNSKIVVCGEINARNGFGGFTGFQAFIASGTDVYVGRVAGMDVADACITDRVFDSRDYAPEMRAAFDAVGK